MEEETTFGGFVTSTSKQASEYNIADHPALAGINTACAEIEEAQANLKRAKQRLHEVVVELPQKIGDNEDLREEIIYHLYWFDDRIPKDTLKKAFNAVAPANAGKNSQKTIIRGMPITKVCQDCRQPFQDEAESFSSREFGKVVCDDCQSKRNQSYKTQGQYQQRQQERIHELSTMSYYDYLQTPEWNERRKRSMKRAGYRCQVCNAYGVQLNVHHRTYERRGNELDRDLITLCKQCHGIFYQNGKLADREVTE